MKRSGLLLIAIIIALAPIPADAGCFLGIFCSHAPRIYHRHHHHRFHHHYHHRVVVIKKIQKTTIIVHKKTEEKHQGDDKRPSLKTIEPIK